jgi:hypothetical protein
VRDSYVTVANKVEQELGLGQLELPVEPLKENETFLCVERALLVHVESELFKAATPALLQLAEYRLSRFWADVIPAIQARWALISSAAEVLIEADRVGKALKTAPTTVPALVKAYADDDEPWCLLDTHHRHMESRKYNFEFAASTIITGWKSSSRRPSSATPKSARNWPSTSSPVPEGQASDQRAAPAAGYFREAGEAAPG